MPCCFVVTVFLLFVETRLVMASKNRLLHVLYTGFPGLSNIALGSEV